MKVLVVGSGAREHAIAVAFLASKSVSEVTVAPGNPGMIKSGIKIENISESDHNALIEFVKNNNYDFAFIGPEVPLMNGIVDDFEANEIPAFGPNKAAAQIEGSKDFAKQLMQRHNIPTAAYQTFSELEPAIEYVKNQGAPIVIKADGLAAGKGVTVATSVDEALAALDDIFVDHRFGKAGAKVVIEEFLEGEEFSLMSFANGTDFWVMPISQDHKRAHDGDTGPNTGGMGAYSPVPQISDEVVKQAIDKIVRPTLQALASEGTPFTGILYAGLINTKQGAKVIEFNARFGDPETEVVLPRLTSDFGEAIFNILHGKEPTFTWAKNGVTLGVVLASEGYPGKLITGTPLPQINLNSIDQHIYYSGVKLDENNNLVTSSGRVALLQVNGKDVKDAQSKAYSILDNLNLSNMFYRHDIASKALKALKN
ncbi:phosphoribosylamine--glycine ligase [Gardnerella piotii]|uniref:phosphoribosylamine--glycine ligase n=1 Tax=Gardnerella piotii TaxID=2792977 RepID=UPI00200ED8E1|nr:phosphoribosylamine--glycine ligase [Gardnerella piotii]UQA81086.1 phosphoribosylamine--glycine ligase [Gardnerella piotii]